MPESIFTRLIKYKPTENVTPVENFSTELLVYVMEYMPTDLRREFLKECWGIEVPEGSKVSFETQKHERLEDSGTVIPDIKISFDKIKHFIEVKVDQDLNSYQLEGGEDSEESKVHDTEEKDSTGIQESSENKIENQLERYGRINDKDFKVHLLSKYLHSDRVFNNVPEARRGQRCLWGHILAWFEKNISEYGNDNLIDHFIQYLKEAKMTVPKVQEYDPAIMQSINYQWQHLSAALDSLSIPKKACNSGGSYFGYYIYLKSDNNKNVGWIGLRMSDYGKEGYKVGLIFQYGKSEELEKNSSLLPGEAERNPGENYDVLFEPPEGYFSDLIKVSEYQQSAMKSWVEKHYDITEQIYTQ